MYICIYIYRYIHTWAVSYTSWPRARFVVSLRGRCDAANMTTHRQVDGAECIEDPAVPAADDAVTMARLESGNRSCSLLEHSFLRWSAARLQAFLFDGPCLCYPPVLVRDLYLHIGPGLSLNVCCSTIPLSHNSRLSVC